MRKRIAGKKLSRGSGARKALFRALIRAQISNGKITTTKAKAKIIQRQIERLINITKSNSIAKKRQIYSTLGNDRETANTLFTKIVPEFTDRVGGYTRLVKLPRRRGDAAEMARLEWAKEIVISDNESVKSKKGKKEIEKKTEKPRIKVSGRKRVKKETRVNK